MFLEYQNEIIGLLLVLVLLVIYLIIKIQRLKRDTLDTLQTPTETDFSQEPFEKPTQKHEQESQNISQDESTLLSTQEQDGSEEGEFDIEEQREDSHNKRKPEIHKRDVPQHGKITKQNFKEFAGIKILVAEDNLINQKVISGLLADSGIKLTMADDGQDALDILEKDCDFLMVLMDAHMPRVDGFEATKIIRNNEKYDHILVVALSGDTAADDIKKMRDAGMAEQLEKPLRMESLYDVLYAYSGPAENVESDAEFVEVPMTKELHGEKGLAICGGDETFYLEILHEFISTYSNSTHTLRELLTTSQLKAADRLLLDIIGVSANIGAEEFTKAANNLKEALQDTKEKSYFTNLEQYSAHLEVLVRDIQDYINNRP